MNPNTKRQIAQDFLEKCANGDSRVAFKQYVATKNFKHHNVYYKGDPETLMLAMEENDREMPDKIFKVLRTLEDGDLVAVHSHFRQNAEDLGWAVMHILRFEEGKIVELWDMSQAVPKDMPNEHGMF
ncbi:nuclear transport factor 2 family protein [Echinicola sediminis]